MTREEKKTTGNINVWPARTIDISLVIGNVSNVVHAQLAFEFILICLMQTGTLSSYCDFESNQPYRCNNNNNIKSNNSNHENIHFYDKNASFFHWFWFCKSPQNGVSVVLIDSQNYPSPHRIILLLFFNGPGQWDR